ncbi:MAG: D-glycero-alpha-D-manno-heptose-1,7-bisphosphate 7-phosphatase [Bacteroidia bacterium]
MKEHKRYLPTKEDCKNYTLFLDRDGVINEPIVDDYAKTPQDFIFCDGAVDALGELKNLFKRVIIVTNQQGVHRQVMSEQDLEDVHLKMYNGLNAKGIRYFDAAFFAPYLRSAEHLWRKPSNGMYTKALEYYEDIDWNKCIMVGDSPGDMALADSKGIIKVRILNPQFDFDNQDFTFQSLADFVDCLS